MRKRKVKHGTSAGLSNRWWKTLTTGGYRCDSCSEIVIGFCGGMKNKRTKRVLCLKCYQKGKN